METITLTRALRELKTLDNRINKQIAEIKSVDLSQAKYGAKALKTKKSFEDFEKDAKASYTSAITLMDRRSKIKAALMKANVETKVTFNNKVYSIAELIDMKEAVDYKRTLHRQLLQQRGVLLNEIDEHRRQIDNQIEQLVMQNTGKDRKIDKEDYEKIAKPFIEANSINLVDPLGTEKVIKDLDEEITKVLDDVDIFLSEANAKTEITLN